MEPRNLQAWPAAGQAQGLSRPPADQEHLNDLLATFEPTTLAQMNSAALLDRSEIKYVMPQRLLAPMLAELRTSYRVLVVADQPCSRYHTLYYDTDEMTLYRRHHAGALDRYKVRTRQYVDSHTTFLEVKHKVGTNHTIKNRMLVGDVMTDLTAQAADFVSGACPYPAEALHARLWNDYLRITLVSKGRPERVTLDFALAFTWEDAAAALPGIVVAEVKYQGNRHASEFVRLMRREHVRDTSFSKYCMGVSLLYPAVKHNKFKAKQRLVARLSAGDPARLSAPRPSQGAHNELN